MVHHGSDRIKQSAEFKQASQARCCYHLIYIGSERRKLLSSVEWQRVVLDEAQNIKIPKRLKPAPSLNYQLNTDWL